MLLEVELASMSDDGVTDVGDDAAQPVGADVGMGIYQYGGIGSMFNEFVED